MQTMKIILQNLPEVIDCQSSQMFLFSHEGIDTNSLADGLNIQKTVLDKKYIDALILDG